MLKLRENTQFDMMSLGEVMLRLDPQDNRIRNTRQFTAWEGGGEYNVARGLRRCFGKKTAVITALADNDIGYLIEDFILQGGVATDFIKWFPFDGVGREVRNGLNFTERGYGVRGALGVSDRGHTAISQLRPEDIDWDHIFGSVGAKWLHTGGIFAALSPESSETALAAIKKAKEHGLMVSYDLNYRPSLWKANGGHAHAQEVNKAIAPYVDVMLGNEEDFSACLGIEIDSDLSNLNIDAYKKMQDKVSKVYPNFKAIATTLRDVHSATDNDWSAICWYDGSVYESISFPHLEIYDRVGGGDSFASGFIYGLLEGKDPQTALNYGVAHGALAMTTPGDTSMARLKEVEKLASGGSARVQR